jgi:Flp pilus assembly protein TadD
LEKNRLEILSDFVQMKPKDSFARYGLAMELTKLGENEKALKHFRMLWEMNPDYTAAYFQAGMLLAKIGQKETAREVLTQGVQAAARNNDLHAKSEIEAALGEL